jgi:hypothetical protein
MPFTSLRMGDRMPRALRGAEILQTVRKLGVSGFGRMLTVGLGESGTNSGHSTQRKNVSTGATCVFPAKASRPTVAMLV